jgi:SAM-dependent methyltransferase
MFADIIDKFIRTSSTVCDMACGYGANTAYLGKRYPEVSFTGIDFNPDDIAMGSDIIHNELKLSNVNLKTGDWYNLSEEDRGVFDGLISFQTLSWMPGYRRELESLAKLNPRWIAISSLFFDGNIDFDIKIHEYDRLCEGIPRESYYNIYSLPKVQEEFRRLGYENFEYYPFDIDIDIPQSHVGHMGTYTQKLEGGKRIQISGPLLMPWYFIVAYKK